VKRYSKGVRDGFIGVVNESVQAVSLDEMKAEGKRMQTSLKELWHFHLSQISHEQRLLREIGQQCYDLRRLASVSYVSTSFRG
jgi:hypothetical protein